MKNPHKQIYFIIDFDSTLVRLEGLDELANIALRGNKDKEIIVKKIKEITEEGMAGKISFGESLRARLELFQATDKHIEKLIRILKKNITPSIQRNKEFFSLYRDTIYIISGGFKDYIVPLFEEYSIDASHILANEFIYDEAGNIAGINKDNFLAQDNGKVKQMTALHLNGTVYVLGDGYTDFQIKASGLASKFFVFCENIRRENVIARADYILPNFDEFLYLQKLPRAYSFPKNRIKVLLPENYDKAASSIFEEEGFDVSYYKDTITEKQLTEAVQGIHVLGIGPTVSISQNVIKAADKLHAVGLFDGAKAHVEVCSLAGIAIFKGTEVSVAEHIILYMNTGDSTASVNLPPLMLPRLPNTHRLIHIHQNIPGMLAGIDRILYEHNVNVEGQYLRTKSGIGYVLTDINKTYEDSIVGALRSIPGTIKVRILY